MRSPGGKPGRTLVTAVLGALCLVGTAQAIDLWDRLKGVLGPKIERKIEKAKEDRLAGAALRALAGYSDEEEIAIGRQAAGNLLGAAGLVNDSALQRYVNRVGRWVASHSERPDLPWRFGVIESDDINAFAAPGGYVLLTRGLYRLLQSESELAGVLAHEIAHITEKHHLKILQQGQALAEGGRILREAGSDERAQNLIGTGAEIFARALDKRAEFEADRHAVVLAARAGYDAYGLPAVLQDIARTAVDDGAVKLLFKTHPHPEERLEALERAMGTRLDVPRGATLERRLQRMQPPENMGRR